jgi:hypothetical protein
MNSSPATLIDAAFKENEARLKKNASADEKALFSR